MVEGSALVGKGERLGW